MYTCIYMNLFLTLLHKKTNKIIFHILFYIFLSLLLCGNPSKKSGITIILLKYVL